MKITTNNLIKKLATETAAKRKRPWSLVFYSSWFLLCVTFLSLFLYIVPLRANLMYLIFHAPYFWTETLLWMILFALLLHLTFQSSIPGRLKANFYLPILALGIALISALIYRIEPGPLMEQINKVIFFLPRCGYIVLPSGFVMATGMFLILRQGAPTRLRRTAVLMALTAGTFNIFLMQFSCKFDGSAHIAIWHMLPVVILSLISIPVGQRLLRW